jgi:hypothetical protein
MIRLRLVGRLSCWIRVCSYGLRWSDNDRAVVPLARDVLITKGDCPPEGVRNVLTGCPTIRCEKPVTTITCIHAAPPPIFRPLESTWANYSNITAAQDARLRVSTH